MQIRFLGRVQQMRKNGRLFIVLGVGLACLAVALAFLMFQNAGKGSAVEKAPVPIKIVVAARTAENRARLTEWLLGTPAAG